MRTKSTVVDATKTLFLPKNDMDKRFGLVSPHQHGTAAEILSPNYTDELEKKERQVCRVKYMNAKAETSNSSITLKCFFFKFCLEIIRRSRLSYFLPQTIP